MMHDHRGLLVMLFGLTLSIATACDGDDKGGDDIDDRTDATDSDDIDNGDDNGCASKTKFDDCMAAPGCAPVYGQELLEDVDGWCSDPSTVFVACMDTTMLCTEPDPADCAIVCPGIEQTLCIGDSVYRAKGCVPNDAVCDVPGEYVGECGADTIKF